MSYLLGILVYLTFGSLHEGRAFINFSIYIIIYILVFSPVCIVLPLWYRIGIPFMLGLMGAACAAVFVGVADDVFSPNHGFLCGHFNALSHSMVGYVLQAGTNYGFIVTAFAGTEALMGSTECSSQQG